MLKLPLIHSDERSPLLTGVHAYAARGGRSVSVTVYGPKHPTRPETFTTPTRRVYVSLERFSTCETPEQVCNMASHLVGEKWREACKAQLWHWRTVEACRPLRERCKPLLTAISQTAKRHYGIWWQSEAGRAMVTRELRAIGVPVPPFGAVMHFLG